MEQKPTPHTPPPLYFVLLPVDLRQYLLKRNYLARDLSKLWIQLRGFEQLANRTAEKAFLYYCSRSGYIKLLQWAQQTLGGKMVLVSRAYCQAALGGHLPVLQWLRSNGCAWHADTWLYAAQGGHLDVLQWLKSSGCRPHNSVSIVAAEQGHLEILQWLEKKKKIPLKRNLVANGAARFGQLHILEWLSSIGVIMNVDTCRAAAYGGHIPILQWLKQNNVPVKDNSITMQAAVFNNGNEIATLQWLYQNGCAFDLEAMRAAKLNTKVNEWLAATFPEYKTNYME